MPKLLFLVRALIAFGLLAGTPSARAEGQEACADRALVVKRLADRYGETLRSMGLNQSDGVVEVYSSEETGTWTILVSRPDGKSCLLAAGQLWEQDVKPIDKPGGDV
jgi:hypothetical protein